MRKGGKQEEGRGRKGERRGKKSAIIDI